jgi:hypothetical protein
MLLALSTRPGLAFVAGLADIAAHPHLFVFWGAACIGA